MGRCKEIVIKVIPASVANPFVKAHHYSGKIVPNSQLHFGAFLDGRLHGVLSYGCSMDKRKTMALVEGTGWNEFLELNRMAFDDYLPRNSESYCIGATLRMIKKQAPHIKWVISFADATQCGDGTIYRASNFVLTGIKKNTQIIELENGKRVAKKTLDNKNFPSINGRYFSNVLLEHGGGHYVDGYQLRYIYFLDKNYRKRLTVPIIPFSEIDKRGAGMYKGENVTRQERHEIKSPEQLEREQQKAERISDG
jgi:hypothetical protein